ncbi:hypothetical protein M2277_004217 [Paenibacillus sp. LBL]|uniref:hypothetical protein n=1 Tax=Paenibacillus sp. LBL TaxID=2940563 RepID=UPI002475817C|nr:hypothetical protein [Paenibacillus sp. LBL]MDH6673552.1 hypothetical protein [Paenibacillus sp. LBL]
MNHNLSLPADTLHSRGRSSVANWGGFGFIAALLLYALFSSPFPADPGIPEALIAVLLILFVSVPTGIIVLGGGFSLYRHYGTVPVIIHAGFFFLLWIGLLNGGVVYGWDMTDIIRDLIPCVYLFVPLLLLPAMKRSTLNWLAILPWIISVMGVILSIRFYLVVQISPLEVGRMYYFDNFLYLPYDPSVSFAGVFLPIMAVHTWKSASPFRWLGSIAMLTGGFLALGSLMAVAQRAPLALAVLCFAVYFLVSSRKSMNKLIIGLIVLVAAGIFAQEQISNSFELLVSKQEDFGANGKTDELAAVLAETSASPYSMLFGVGWGGLFHDPAVNNILVSYTHSAVSFFLLKGGLIGIAVLMSYLGWIMYRALQRFTMVMLPYMLAAFVPVVIGLLFQVSYKTLSYGMILTLICLIHKDVGKVHTNDQKNIPRQ